MITTTESRSRSGGPAIRVGGPRVGEIVFALLVIAFGVFTLVGAFTIHVPAGNRVGPTAFPLFVSVLLLAAGTAVLIGVFRGNLGAPEESEDIDRAAKSTDWLTIGKIVAALLVHLLLIDLIGWSLSATVLFGAVAWALGAKRWWMAVVIGFLLAFTVQIVLGELLGLSLPLGPVFEWIAPLL